MKFRAMFLPQPACGLARRAGGPGRLQGRPRAAPVIRGPLAGWVEAHPWESVFIRVGIFWLNQADN